MKIGDIVYLNSDLDNENPLTITHIETTIDDELDLRAMGNKLVLKDLITVSYFAKSKFGKNEIQFRIFPIEALHYKPENEHT